MILRKREVMAMILVDNGKRLVGNMTVVIAGVGKMEEVEMGR